MKKEAKDVQVGDFINFAGYRTKVLKKEIDNSRIVFDAFVIAQRPIRIEIPMRDIELVEVFDDSN